MKRAEIVAAIHEQGGVTVERLAGLVSASRAPDKRLRIAQRWIDAALADELIVAQPDGRYYVNGEQHPQLVGLPPRVAE